MEVRNLILALGLGLLLWGEGGMAAGLPKGRLNHLIIATSAYGQVGRLDGIDVPSGSALAHNMPIHSDAIVRAPAGDSSVYVVNRLGQDNIQVVTKDLSRTLRQFSVGRRSNAQDIAVVRPDLAYVTRLNARKLLKVNPATGRALGEVVDLSSYAYADGIPQMARLHFSGNRLLVQLQRLNVHAMYAPTDYSLVAEVDTTTDRLVRVVRLAYTNPVSDFRASAGSLYVGGAGAWGKPDGGIEEFDDATFTSRRRVIDEAELGGDLLDFDILDAHHGLAIISAPGTKVVSFDPSSGKRIGTVAESSGFDLMQLLRDDERKVVYLIDRDLHRPAIRVFDAASLTERTDLRWNLTLPPFQMALTD